MPPVYSFVYGGVVCQLCCIKFVLLPGVCISYFSLRLWLSVITKDDVVTSSLYFHVL